MTDGLISIDERRGIGLYADENFPGPVVLELRRMGHDVLTAQEAGQAGRKVPDEDVLSFAHADGRAVLTHNRKDFVRLHRQTGVHSGIIVCTQNTDWIQLASRIDQVITSFDSMDGQLIKVNRPPG